MRLGLVCQILLSALLGSGNAVAGMTFQTAGSDGEKTNSAELTPTIDPSIEYYINPGDVLTISVWKEPELSKNATVRWDGQITIPLLGDVSASGRTPLDLGQELQRELARFVQAPQVTVGVAQANSARFFVIGQVNRSGSFPLIGRVTVLQALALAGGFSTFAKKDKIVVIRDLRGTQEVLQVNYKKLMEGKDLRTNVVLRPGDTVVVP